MIHDISPVNSYSGNNSTREFCFDFYIEDESQLEVYLIKKDNTREKLVYRDDYTIDQFGNANGSYITFPSSNNNSRTLLAPDERISLQLSLKPVQQIQYNNSSLLNLESIEYSFDYLTRLVQILKRRLELCVKVEEGIDEQPEAIINKITNTQEECSQLLKTINDKIAEVDKIIKDYASKPSNPGTSNPRPTETPGTSNPGTSCDCVDYSSQIQNILSQITQLNNKVQELEDSSGSTTPGTSTGGVQIVESYEGEDKNYYYRKWSNGFIEQFVAINYPPKFYGTYDLPVAFETGEFSIIAGESVFNSDNVYVATEKIGVTKIMWRACVSKTGTTGVPVPDKVNLYCYGY